MWTFVSVEGTTYNGDLGSMAVYSCLDSVETVDAVGPAQKATGWVVLDVPAWEGTSLLDQGGPGWEWALAG